MNRFIINGQSTLKGRITVSGSKNAALPLIFSTIALKGVSTIRNLPLISDVLVALKILEEFGARIYYTGGDSVSIDTRELVDTLPSEALTSKIRASSYLIGARLARFSSTNLQRFGGCNFDNRPIDMHLSAAQALGAVISENSITASRLYGADIHFDKISVGATVNAILMSTAALGESRIFGYAREPHIIALIDFLNSAGAKITVTQRCITVKGSELSGGEATVIPDMIEAGTYSLLSLLTKSDIEIVGADTSHLHSFFEPFREAGARFVKKGEILTASGRINKRIAITTAPYPEYPTDLQPQATPLLACNLGGTVTEGVWSSRFGYLSELSKFGVKYTVGKSSAEIFPSRIRPARVTAPDLRGGAALLLAALVADGESEICSSEIIGRGYSDIVGKLRGIGAKIQEIIE